MATLEVIPPDVVKATVGETVTAVTVVSVVSVLLHVLLVAHELDCVVQVVVEVESLLVTGSNCKIKQNESGINTHRWTLGENAEWKQTFKLFTFFSDSNMFSLLEKNENKK